MTPLADPHQTQRRRKQDFKMSHHNNNRKEHFEKADILGKTKSSPYHNYFFYLPDPCCEGTMLDCPLGGYAGIFPGNGGKFLNPSSSGMSPKKDQRDASSQIAC